MAGVVQAKLRRLKPTAKNVVDKFKEVLDQCLQELKDASALEDGLEAFIGAGISVLFSSSNLVPSVIMLSRVSVLFWDSPLL